MILRWTTPFSLASGAIGLAYAMGLRGAIALGYLLVIVSTCVLIADYPWPGMIILGLMAIRQAIRRPMRTSGSYGTARFASTRTLLRSGMLGGDRGLILGRAFPLHSAWEKFRSIFLPPIGRSRVAVRRFVAGGRQGELIRVPGFTHAVTIGPSGSGKGAAFIIPFLLSDPGSVVVHDTKGELCRLTARHRRKRFGHRIVHLNFWNESGMPSALFNPLDLIDPNAPEALDLARAMGDAMVERTGEERDPHFNDSASLFISSMIAWIAAHARPDQRHLQTVREVLASADATANAIRHMATSDAMGGLLRRQALSLSHYRDRELGSVMTTVGRSLQWLDSLPVAKHMAASSFDPKALRRTGRMSIYITIPERFLATNRGLLRLLFGSLLRAITADGVKHHG
jgi:type IV secretion system protein VirD4